MTASLRVLVVDDEEPARRTLADLLAAEPDVAVVGECSSTRQAIASIRELAPDAVFLDVRMGGGDGFAVIEEVGVERMPAVVFVTAYDAYAVRAFEVQALDYLLKPFDEERLRAAVARARAAAALAPEELVDRLRALVGSGRAAPGGYARRLRVPSSGRTTIVEAAELDWIGAEDYYARLHTAAGSYLLRESLRSLEERLDPAEFCRVHRSAIVRLDRVRELRPTFRGDAVAVLKDGTRVQVSRSRRAELEGRLVR